MLDVHSALQIASLSFGRDSISAYMYYGRNGAWLQSVRKREPSVTKLTDTASHPIATGKYDVTWSSIGLIQRPGYSSVDSPFPPELHYRCVETISLDERRPIMGCSPTCACTIYLDSAVENNQSALSTATMEFLLESFGPHPLPRWECCQRQRQHTVTRH